MAQNLATLEQNLAIKREFVGRLSTASRTHAETELKLVQPGQHPMDVARVIESKKTAVKALTSTNEVDMMVTYFLERGKYRDACLFVIGCNTNLRISDILQFRWKDILIDENTARLSDVTIEQKTKKFRRLYYNAAIAEAVWLYREHLGHDCNPDDFMFTSDSTKKCYVPLDCRRRKEDRKTVLQTQPMHTRSAARIIRTAAKELGLYTEDRHVATHSMR